MMHRSNDIRTIPTEKLTIYVNNEAVHACAGESVLGVLFALGIKGITKNNMDSIVGAYCGMGVCYCCTVTIDGVNKQRACQTIVYSDMRVETQTNLLSLQDIDNE